MRLVVVSLGLAAASLYQPVCKQLTCMLLRCLSTLWCLSGLEPDASLQLQQQLWGEMTLGALLFALRWDGAVRVRRAAVQLLQRVALPLQGDMVGQLAALLADKCSDRDVQVRVSDAGAACGLPLVVHVWRQCWCSRHLVAVSRVGISLCPAWSY